MSIRIEALKSLLASKKLDGCIVADEKNMQYFTGFSGGSILLVPTEGENILFVYAINYEAAKEETQNATVELMKQGEKLVERIADEIDRLRLRRVDFDTLRVSSYLELRDQLKDKELEASEEMIWSLRKVKDEAEVALIKKSAELTSKGMEKACEVLEAGLREREVAAEIEYEMRKSGSEGVAFDTIVSSGPRSAFPHGGCGERQIKEGDVVMIDLGAKYGSYCSDLTRTFAVGKPSPKQTEIFETVKKAQEAGMNQIGAGVEAKEVDKAARQIIEDKGYGEYFVHSLGHGVGLEVHEPPTLSPMSKDVLASGNVVTVEPGIYIPGLGGVRIEDTVLVLSGEAKKLTDAPVVFNV